MTVTQAIRQEGIQQGMQTKTVEIARNMLKKREPKEKVVGFTGLSNKELDELIQEMGLN